MHRGAYKRKTLKEKFDKKWIIDPETGCWLWIASMKGCGYGAIWSEGTTSLAHRVAYELYRECIPNGLQIDHLCRLRHCVNPWHLEVVTGSVNIQRGLLPILHAQVNFCPQGHEYTEANTYVYMRKSSSGRLVHRRMCRECKRNWNKLYRLKQKQTK
jgi:hypothetical protein